MKSKNTDNFFIEGYTYMSCFFFHNLLRVLLPGMNAMAQSNVLSFCIFLLFLMEYYQVFSLF